MLTLRGFRPRHAGSNGPMRADSIRSSVTSSLMSPLTSYAARFVPAIAIYLAAIFPSQIALADVYKCTGEGGIPVYQEMPCGQGAELRNFQTDPPPLTILPAQGGLNIPPGALKDAPRKNANAGQDAKSAKIGARAAGAAERKHIQIGMSEADVLARLGHPDMTAGGKNGAGARWTYLPAPADPETTTTLTFAKGTVTTVDRKVVKK